MNKQNEPIGWFRVALALLLLGGCVWFIWSNSALSPAESGRRSQMVADFLVRVLRGLLDSRSPLIRFVQANVRKIAHAVEFFVLGSVSVMMLIVLRRIHGHMLLHAVLLVLSVAVADESIQIFSGRGAMVQDVLLDFVGGMVGILTTLAAYAVVRGVFARR